jgi:hypothetical protein
MDIFLKGNSVINGIGTKDMKKYLLVGGIIIVVVLLVLGSLSSVVGYWSVKSTLIPETPLFNIRTQRATRQQQSIISSQYLGKGKNSDFFSLARNETIAFAVETIQRIKAMSETKFSHFITYVVQQVHQNNKFRNVDEKTLVTRLYQLRQNQPLLKEYTGGSALDVTWHDTPTDCWFPGCFVVLSFYLVYIVIVMMILLTLG